MANSTDTSTIFRAIALLVALFLVIAGALIYVQSTGGPSPDDWRQLEAQAQQALAGDSAVSALNSAADGVAASTSEILELSNELLDRSGATAIIQEFQQRASNIGAAATGLATADDAATVLAGMTADVAYLNDVANGLNGETTTLDIGALNDEGREVVLVPLAGHMATLGGHIETLNNNVDAIAGVAAGQAAIAAAADELRSNPPAGGLAAALPGFLRTQWIPIAIVALAAVLVIVLLILNGRSAVFEKTAKEQADQNDRNQQAILRLLDEMGSLADGDLTVEATVTEDITGTIADSFNFAIEELRKLVTTVNETAIMVDSAAKQTENTAAHMARAADNQTREINAATESIVSMAASIEEVSGNAERSSDVARHSVEVAHKGGEAVRRTIDGMNTIRETIQDTSKRIKRLGESSQEIGNIVELINDIAEQTNILALNASIQASMAGEAGRGFAVVADEVQRLAERSTNATKQIEVLVSTIQADTKEAVVSMERSTTDVVGGALLAENAGAALDEIEQVSNQIASLVQNISSSARQQAGSAADVTRRTSRLSEISEQTGKATTATAAAISKLSEFASQLRNTVAGFTLPQASMPATPLQAAAPEAAPPKNPQQATAG